MKLLARVALVLRSKSLLTYPRFAHGLHANRSPVLYVVLQLALSVR
jgi:hypothetical protein